MRKSLFFLFILLFGLGTFLVGSWVGHRETATNKSSPIFPRDKVSAETDPDQLPPGTVRITPDKRQTIGIHLGTVERSPSNQKIRILGRVAADETRIYFINATVDGWVTKTYPNSTGSLVKKNEVLATFYSPEFLSAAQALLYALGSADRVQTSGRESPIQKDQLTQFNLNIQQYKDSLRNLGMGELQVEKMIQTRKWIENVDVTSPANGFIIARKVSQGLRFNKGDEMYRIADLSRVWILADVYGKEVRYFKPGLEAKVILPSQEKTYLAKVSQVLPVFDPATRTLKVRLELDNPGFTLRPDMFVDVELPVSTAPAITVPADAVMDTGLKKTVFVDRGNGFFEPREVETGWRMGSRVEITKGLTPGEKIVTSGTFLIDSESRMELAAAGITGSLSKDPVSGLEVSTRKSEKAGLKSSYRGHTYYFSSNESLARFKQDPGRYATSSP